MNIFLTGASGFLGGHIAKLLCAQGHQVYALLRKSSERSHLQFKNLHFVVGSLPECNFDLNILENCDTVIHCAGLVKAKNQEEFFKINAQGTRALVEKILKLKSKPKHFIHISTLAVLNPDLDGIDFCIPPEHCHPVSDYGKSKLEAEKKLSPLKGKLNLQILRPPVLYGPRDTELVPLLKQVSNFRIAPLFGKGNRRFSICHAQDVARAVLAQLKPKHNFGIYCLDDGAALSWKELFKTVGKVTQKNITLFPIPEPLYSVAALAADLWSKVSGQSFVFGREKIKEMKMQSWVCGYEKLNDDFAWEPEIKLQQGLKDVL